VIGKRNIYNLSSDTSACSEEIVSVSRDISCTPSSKRNACNRTLLLSNKRLIRIVFDYLRDNMYNLE
jgi:predicted oxidoreductase (fatty acid repression mutant protein)